MTPSGAAGPFGYLDGTVPFEDNDPGLTESYGCPAVPLERQADGATCTSYGDPALPGSSARGSPDGTDDSGDPGDAYEPDATVRVGDLSAHRDFVDVRNVARAAGLPATEPGEPRASSTSAAAGPARCGRWPRGW